MLMKIRKAKKQMQDEIGREPSAPELAHYMEIPVAKLQQYTQCSRNVVSLENPLRPTNSGKNDLDTRTIGDTIASDAPTPLEDAQREWLRQDLEQVLQETLTLTERTVLLARYGLEDGHSMTLEETSRHLGVSRERVRLVEARALNKLRSPQKNYRLKTYLSSDNSFSSSAQPSLSKTAASAKEEDWFQTKNTRAGPIGSEENIDRVNPFACPCDYASLPYGPASVDSRKGAAEGFDEDPTRRVPDRLWFF